MWTNRKKLNFYINDLRFFLPNSKLIILATYAYKENTKKITIVDYNQSHVVTFNEYLKIMWQITMDKETTKMV